MQIIDRAAAIKNNWLYVKKPVEVEAIHFHNNMWEEMGKVYKTFGVQPYPYFHIDTLEGTMEVSDGDWIIRGVKGEHYPCKPYIFEATYDKVVA